MVGTIEATKEPKGKVAVGFHSNEPYDGCPSVKYEFGMKQKYEPVTVVDFKVKVEAVEGTAAAEDGVKAGILNVVDRKLHGEISSTL